ncbi:MAG: hypothetical protein KY455_01105 [Euryarchaeota archaeon]|nr:hypothetical protein [Euryarchaeota archaeon]
MSRALASVALLVAGLLAGCVTPLESPPAYAERFEAAMVAFQEGFEPHGDIQALTTELHDLEGGLLATVETELGENGVLHATASARGERFELYCHGDTVLVQDGDVFVSAPNAPFSCSDDQAQALLQGAGDERPAPRSFEDHDDGSFTAFLDVEVPEQGMMAVEVLVGADDKVRSLGGSIDGFTMTFIVQYGEKRHIEMPEATL